MFNVQTSTIYPIVGGGGVGWVRVVGGWVGRVLGLVVVVVVMIVIVMVTINPLT